MTHVICYISEPLCFKIFAFALFRIPCCKKKRFLPMKTNLNHAFILYFHISNTIYITAMFWSLLKCSGTHNPPHPDYHFTEKTYREHCMESLQKMVKSICVQVPMAYVSQYIVILYSYISVFEQ